MREDDPQQSQALPKEDDPGSTIDVADATMLDLLNDPGQQIRKAVAALLAEGAYRDDVRRGWQNYLP